MRIPILVFTLFLLLLQNECIYAANIVYPHRKETKIESPYTFFIGNDNPSSNLKINDEQVKLHTNGAFRHNVNLKFGENIFKISNDTETKTYKIYRPHPIMKMPAKNLEPKIYENSIFVETTKNSVPLRSTPVDAGINRLQHLQPGILLEAIGEFKNFYKIKLADNTFAWISKENVKITDNTINMAKIISFSYDENESNKIFKMKLDRKVPYILTENNGLNIKIFNINGFNSDTYEFNIENNGKLYGYNSEFTDDNELVILVKNKPDTDESNLLKNLKITVDPGHGGKENGTTGCLGEREKNINLDIALNLAKKLEQHGAEVFLTRTDDSEVSLKSRVDFANKNNSQIFLSIHCNALPDSLAMSDITGTEVYYFYPQAKELAENILKSITQYTGLRDHGAKAQSFAVIRNTNSVSILIEVGYLINPEEEEKIIDKSFQDKVTDGIINGLENYLKQ